MSSRHIENTTISKIPIFPDTAVVYFQFWKKQIIHIYIYVYNIVINLIYMKANDVIRFIYNSKPEPWKNVRQDAASRAKHR